MPNKGWSLQQLADDTGQPISGITPTNSTPTTHFPTCHTGEYTAEVSHQFINEAADVDDRQPGNNVLAHDHAVDKALGGVTEVGTHEAPRGAEGPALG